MVSTGFAVRRKSLDAGVGRLERMGFRVRLGEGVLAREGYLAGDDERRASDLEAMLDDPEVRAVWFARGGYGTARILERIPWSKLRRRPKLLIGYSDLTALFTAAIARADLVCLYGPVVVELGDDDAYHPSSLRRALKGETTTLRFAKRQVLAGGRARGRLLGGNLTVFNHLWGTRFQPDLRGSVLFLEEVGEEIYRVDRMLTQMRQAGAFKDLAAVLLGELAVPARRRFPPDRPLDELLRETFLPLGVPVICGLPAGHLPGKWTLPLGGVADVDCGEGHVRFTS